jgi:hypothetical protein
MLDRFVLWVMRSLSITMLLAGASVFVAAVPVFALAAASPATRTAAGTLFQIGFVFVAGGFAGRYLALARDRWFPNEVREIADRDRPRPGGWLIAAGVALAALPVWALFRLQPFLAEWRFVVGLLSAADFWNGADAGPSGLVLLPIAAALTPPALALLALMAFPLASGILLPLLLARRVRFPRVFVIAAVLLAALVLASVRGASAMTALIASAEQLIDRSSARPGEVAELRNALARYGRAVSSTAPVLVWTTFGYLMWVPGMFVSRRVHETFAHRASGQVADPFGSTALEPTGSRR